MTHRRACAVAGQFYPDDPVDCLTMLDQILGRPLPGEAGGLADRGLPVAGVVPHAGWVYSGAVAGRVLRTIAAGCTPSTVVLFGADHWGEARRHPELDPDGSWQTPIGDVEIDAELAHSVNEVGRGLIDARASAHRREHSIEVHVPLVNRVWPRARILPILVAPGDEAPLVGQIVARACAERDDVVALGSSDLTHYGPRYGFTPEGPGRRGLEWVKRTNDPSMIRLITGLRIDDVVPEAEQRWNACGAGAIAAAMAYAKERGARCGELVEYVTSYDVRARGEPSDFVGYAGVVFRALHPERAVPAS